MKKGISVLLVILSLLGALSGCGTSVDSKAFTDGNKIPYSTRELEDLDGAASVERQADVKDSTYFKQLDFYNMKSTEPLTILTEFKTIQQATEWTCGPTSLLMVLEWLGVREDMDELDLADLRHKDRGGATNLRQMLYMVEEINKKGGKQIDFYSTYDLEGIELDSPIPVSPEYTETEIPESMILDSLKKGDPVLIGWDDWGGHWTVVIGYDTMGTETTADDVLIIADPYDTTDHCQDGYVIQSFERLYYNWKNTFDPQFKNNAFLILSVK